MNFSHKFAFPGALKALLLLASIPLPLSFLAGCRHQAVLAADQPVPVRLRTPNLAGARLRCSQWLRRAQSHGTDSVSGGGRVARVYVEEGQFVKKGQILAELDSTDYRNAFDSAAGQAAAAKAAALQAKNGVRTQELEEARVDFERARDEYQRQKYLYDHGSLPALDFHKYQAAYLASEQRYNMAKEGTRLEEKDASIARQQGAEANYSQARKRLSDCQLPAPVSGFIGMKKVDVGDYVEVGNAVFSVLDLDPVKVRVGIPIRVTAWRRFLHVRGCTGAIRPILAERRASICYSSDACRQEYSPMAN